MGNEITKSAQGGAVINTKNKTIKGMLANPDTAWGRELANLLPSPKEVARFMSCALSQLADPKVGSRLAQCDLASFYNAIMKSARSGIVPDGVNAYLIPYGKECTLQFSYRGLCDMAIREGIAKKFVGDIIRKNDIWKWSNGELVEHTITTLDEKERGDVIGVWVRAFLPDGERQDLIMSKSEIDKIRSKSKNPNGVWAEWPDEMAKKSALKRLFKTMRNTPALAEAVAVDNENYNLDKAEKDKSHRVVSNSIDFGDDDGTVATEKPDAVDAEIVNEKKEPVNADGGKDVEDLI